MDCASQRVNNRPCCVEYCTNTLKNCNLTFFRVPEKKHPEKAKKWLSALKFKPNLPKTKWICSDHFEMKYFTSTLKKKLIVDAFPTLQRKILENNDFRAVQSAKFHVLGSNNESTCAREWMGEANSNELIVSKMFPVLNDEQYFKNKQKFINNIVEDYLHKRYANNAKQVKRKYLDGEMNSLKKPVLIDNNIVKIETTEVSEFPSDNNSGFNNIIAELIYDSSASTRHSKKVVQTSSVQSSRKPKNSIQSENVTKLPTVRNCVSSKLSEKVTEIPREPGFLLQENMSSVPKPTVQPETITEIAYPQNSVLSKLPTATGCVAKITNPHVPSKSLTNTENSEKITHPQNRIISNPPTLTENSKTTLANSSLTKPQILTENVASVPNLQTCDTFVSALQPKTTNLSNPQDSTLLSMKKEFENGLQVSNLQSDTAFTNSEHIIPARNQAWKMKSLPSVSMPQNGSFETRKLVSTESENDIFYKIGIAIADDFRKIKNPDTRVKALKKIQEILSEAKSCDSNGVAF